MESLCKFKPLNLPALVLEHMYKTFVKLKGKHGMGYGYFLTKVFNPLNVPGSSTLVECEFIEVKIGKLSNMSQLVAEWNQLKHELEEMTELVGKKNAE
ncbi:hypothetical protein H5410_015153, partial [Solanum commersonii]